MEMEAARFVKRLYPSTKLHGVTFQNTVLLVNPQYRVPSKSTKNNEIKTYKRVPPSNYASMVLNATNLQAASKFHRDKPQAIGGLTLYEKI